MPGVEFLEPEPATGPLHADRDPGPHRRRTVLVLVAVGALMVALLVARGVSSRHEAGPTPTTSHSVDSVIAPDAALLTRVLSQQPGRAVVGYCPGSDDLPGTADHSSVIYSVTLNATDGSLVLPTGPRSTTCARSAATCPGAASGHSTCATTDTIRAAVLDAVEHAYPGARLAIASTETVRRTKQVWYRLLVFALPQSRTLRIDVTRMSLTSAGVAPQSHWGDEHVARAGSVHGSSLVTLATIVGPGGPRPDLGALTTLAADPALISPN